MVSPKAGASVAGSVDRSSMSGYDVRRGARDGTLNARSDEVLDIALHRLASLLLTRGVETSRRENPPHATDLCRTRARSTHMSGLAAPGCQPASLNSVEDITLFRGVS